MPLLVRHAHAGDKRYWTGPDAERPLSIRGWDQAEGLCHILDGVQVKRLFTSPSLRCRQTLLPLAANLGLQVEPVDDLGLDGDVDHVVQLVTAPDSDGAVLCTHGEILGRLLDGLRESGLIQSEGRLRYEKGSTWALDGPAGGRYHARYLPPREPDPRRAGSPVGIRAELGRLAVEQQRLLATIGSLARTTQRLAARLGPRLAALEAERAATLSHLDQVRETARALARMQAQVVDTQRPLLGRLLRAATQQAPPARMVAGLTDVGAVLATATGGLARQRSGREWTVLAEQPLAVGCEPGQVERLMAALLSAADQTLPPTEPTWVIARAAGAGAVIAVSTDPASLPLDESPSRPAMHRSRSPSSQWDAPAPFAEAERLAARLGGELAIVRDGSAAARQVLLRFPLAALPDEVWPDQPPFPAEATAMTDPTHGRPDADGGPQPVFELLPIREDPADGR